LRNLFLCFLCSALCLLGAFSSAAATERHGQVTFGGVPIPGATVMATQGDKKFVAITDQMGAYSFPDLPDGMWAIEVEMLGFTTLKGDVNTTTWELKMLPLEEMKADIAHNDAPPPAASAPAATAVTTAPANGKPAANGRNAANQPRQGNAFTQTQVNANANAQATQQTDTAAPASSAFANVSQSELNNRAADGLLINGTVNNGAASPFAQSAAFGNSRRGIRSLYNGNIGVTNDNSALDAHTYSFTGQNTQQPSYNRMTANFNFGGPLKIPGIIKNNNGPNFFVGYQRTQNSQATLAPGRMPTDLERQGDFSQSVISTGPSTSVPITIYDPLNLDPVTKQPQPFPGNRIPIERISPQAQALLSLYPKPNKPNALPTDSFNYQVPILTATHQDSLSTRLNKTINQKNTVFGNFDMQGSRNSTPSLFNFLDTGRSVGINTAVNWTNRPTQRFSLTMRYQFSRFTQHTTPYFANVLNVSAAAGITGNNQDAVNWGSPGLTMLGGTSSLNDAQYSSNRTESNSFSYSSFWNHGRHTVQFGGDVRRQQVNVFSQQDARGTFTFNGAATGVPAQPPTDTNPEGTPAKPGSDIADFLLGIPDASSLAFGNADKYYRQTFYDGFIGDDWRVNGSLTLNLTGRWEYETPVSEKYSRLVNLNVGSNFAANDPVVGNGLVHSDKVGFMPRVAFAWRPIAASSVIVRGSYGVYRNTNVYQSIAVQMAQQAPLSTSLSVQNTPATPLTLANGFTAVPGATKTLFAIDPNFHVGFVQNWSLQIQRDLPAALQMTALYLGTKGSRLPQEFLPNTYPTGPVGPAGYIFLGSNGNSSREAGQIQLRRRLRNGFTASVQYTFAKALDNAPLMAGGQVVTVTQGGASIAQDWKNLQLERARSNFDQRHQLIVQAQYTSGSGLRGGALLSGWKGTLLKEWLFAPSLTIGSGLPLNPVYTGIVQGTGVTGNQRPDYTGAPIKLEANGKFLNPAAFQAPPAGRWGNAGRNSINGPSQFALNASLGRTFRMGDRYNMELRVDATNVLNRVTITSWNTTFNNLQFGSPVGYGGMRNVQSTLRLRF
jgi:hypothetical protein